ncbi:MAG TPA: hypothetical protein VGS03_01350 [Candidatus Polarisedimenticolia bacterium]|nr:hypothetical protein [Candidatus Polarisedimenticolia bacterium]
MGIATGAAVLAVFAAITALCLTRATDTDLYWHVATGHLIQRTYEVPRADAYSYTASGQPWVDSQWLFQVLAASIWDAGGAAGVTLAAAAVVVALFAFLYRRGRKRAGPVMTSGVLLLAALASQERFLTRPEVVSYLFLAGTIAILDRAIATADGMRRRLLLWLALPALVLPWVNMQALFILGPAMTALAGVAALVEAAWRPRLAREGHNAPAPRAAALFLSLALQALAALANPHGVRALRLPFELFFDHLGGQTLLARTISEFQPTLVATPRTVALPAFLALAALTTLAIAFNRGDRRLFEVLVAVAAFALALQARRNLPIFAIAASPILLRNAASVWQARGAWTAPGAAGGPRRGVWWPALLLAAAGAALTFDVASGRFFLRTPTERWFGLGEIPYYFPEDAAAFVERSRLPGQVFHPLATGGYLVHAWAFDRRVFIDGRNDPYLHGVLATYLRAVADPAGFEEVARKYQVTTVLWPHEQALEGRALLKWLAEGHGWSLAYVDAGAAVWVRNDVAGPMTGVGSPPGFDLRPENQRVLLRQQLAARPFAGPPIREIAIAHYLSLVGDAAGAEEFLRTAIEAIPRNASLRHDLGLQLERQGKREEARDAYRASAALDPGFGPAQSALASLALEAGDVAEAGRRAETAWRAGDRSARTWATRARLLEEQGKEAEAEALWDEAVAALPGHPGILLAAARSHARRGDTRGAIILYEQLLLRSPGDPVAQSERAALGAAGDVPAGPPR